MACMDGTGVAWRSLEWFAVGATGSASALSASESECCASAVRVLVCGLWWELSGRMTMGAV